jgi:hypothetical protein
VSFTAFMVESVFVVSGMTAAAVLSVGLAVESVGLVESAVTTFGDGAPPPAGSGLDPTIPSDPTGLRLGLPRDSPRRPSYTSTAARGIPPRTAPMD